MLCIDDRFVFGRRRKKSENNEIHFRPKTKLSENSENPHFGSENENEIRSVCILSNKCIGDDTNAAVRRSPNCIRKTRNTFCGTLVPVPLPKFCENCFPMQNFTEIGQSATELWPKIIFNMTAVRHFEL